MRSVTLLFLVAGTVLAGDILGTVPGAEPRDLADAFRVIDVFNGGVVVVGDEARLPAVDGRVLDREPEGKLYYRVHPLDEDARARLSTVGRVLDSDGQEYLMRVAPADVERLLGMRVMAGPLDLRGWVLNDKPPGLPPVTANPIIEQLVASVDPDSVLSYVRRLQEFWTRYTSHESCYAAADWIADKFRQFGADTVILQSYRGDYAPNVIAVKYGTSGQHDPYAIVCGHFDSYTTNHAPGADDNASGTAAAIEALRVMNGYLFTHDLKFIAWSGEETGLNGSRAYANEARSRGDSILAVLNADMIGYVDAAPEDCNLMAKTSNPPCEPLADFFIAVADTYTTLGCVKQMMSNNQNSDHGPFWDNGYVALTAIEDFWPVNPHYHTSHDSIGAGYNDNDFCTEVTRAQVAALATLGQPVPLNQPLVGLVRARLDDSVGNANGKWDAGESVDVYLTLKNYGMLDAHSVSALVTTPDTLATMLADSAWFGDINSQDTTAAVPVRVVSSPDTPREHVVRFDMTIVAAETTWQAGFSFQVGEYVATDPIPDGPREPALYWAYDDVDTGYVETPEFEWVDVAGIGTRLDLSDDQTVQVDLPPAFGPFVFYNRRYGQVSICGNGWLGPGFTTARDYENHSLPNSTDPTMLALVWDDLYPPSSGDVWWYHDADNHRFVVQWDSMPYYSGRTTYEWFQLVIYDTTVAAGDGNSEFTYQYLTANAYNSATVGMHDSIDAVGIQCLCDGSYRRGAATIRSGSAVKFTTDAPETGVEDPTWPAGRTAGLRVSPNPAFGRVRVRFQVPATGRAELLAFDRAGRRVAVLADVGPGSPGHGLQSVEWDARGLAPGVYFLTLRTDYGSETVKAVLAR